MGSRGGTAARIASRARRWLIWTHRYVGIPLSPLFVLWFVSGVVMMYTGGMPELTPEERLERRPPLDLSRVRLTPAAAASTGGVRAPQAEAEARLLSVLGRPAYRFDDVTVFADDGARLSPIGPDEAREVVRRFTGAPASAIAYEGLVEQPDRGCSSRSSSFPPTSCGCRTAPAPRCARSRSWPHQRGRLGPQSEPQATISGPGVCACVGVRAVRGPDAYAACTVRPPTTVRTTPMFLMSSGSASCGSRSRTTKSASLPGVIEPLSRSS